jgi:hypothetical protein
MNKSFINLYKGGASTFYVEHNFLCINGGLPWWNAEHRKNHSASKLS